MIDDFNHVTAALSIGIGGDVSWDFDLAERAIDVFQYDHTVTGPPMVHSRFHFRPIGIGPKDDTTFRSLDRMVSDIPATGDLILKIDVEGAEWASLAATGTRTLKRFSQIVIELHGPLSGSRANQLRNLRTLKQIGRTHAVVHVHANNYGPVESFGGVRIPNVIEVTFLRKGGFHFDRSRVTLPIHLDVPNDPSKPEIPMSEILDQ